MIPLGILASSYVAPAGGVTLVDPSTVSEALWNIQASDLGADGTAISAWGSYFVQTDPAKQPIVDTLDGIKCAYFDGTEILLQSSYSYGLNKSQTMFAVVRPGFSTGIKAAIGVSTGTGVRLDVNTLKARQAAHGGDWAYNESANSGTLNGWCVISGRFINFTSFSARMNLGPPTTTSTTTSATPDRRNQIGGNSNSPSWIGGIAEAWNFGTALSDEDWAGIVAYLADKYSIAI